MDDPERPRVTVPDLALGFGQRVFEDVDLDAVVGERAGLVEPEGLQVAGDDLHGGYPAPFHGGDEVHAVVEGGGVAAPEAQARRVGEPVDRGGARRRGVQHPGVGQCVLQAQSRESLLRRFRLASPLCGGTRGVRHGVRLVEHDHAVERVAGRLVRAAGEPVDDLVEPCGRLAVGGRPQRRVGGEQDAGLAVDRLRRPVVGQREEVAFVAADLAPVAPGVLEEARGLRDPERPLRPAQPAVEDDRRGLAALAAPGAVAEHPALAEAHGLGERRIDDDVALEEVAVLVDRHGAYEVLVDPVAGGQQPVVGLAGECHALQLRIRQEAVRDQRRGQEWAFLGYRRRDVGHCGGLDQRRRVLQRARHAERDGRPRRPGGPVGTLVPAFAGHRFDVEFARGGIQRQAWRQFGETPDEIGRVLDDCERIGLGIAVRRRRGGAFEDDEARLHAGAAAAVEARRDADGEQDARRTGPAAERLAPGGGLRDAVGAGHRDQAPARRQRGAGGLQVQQVDVAPALADGRARGERRIHEHDLRTHPRQPVADVLGVVLRERCVGEDLRQQRVAHRGELVQEQLRRGVENRGGERREYAGSGRGLQDRVAGPHVRRQKGRAGERQRRRELVEGDLVLGAVRVRGFQRGDAFDHGEERVRGLGRIAHAPGPTLQEQDRGRLGRVVAELGVPGTPGRVNLAPGVVQGGRDDGRGEAVAGFQEGNEVAGRFGDGSARFHPRRGGGFGGSGVVVDEVEQGSGFRGRHDVGFLP